MEYPKIISLVPEAEHFDASVIGEGVWLSVGHVNNIEETLAQSAGALEDANLTVQQGVKEVELLNTTIADMTAAATTSTEKITELEGTIATLNARVTELGGESSGAGTVIIGTEEKTAEEKESNHVRFDSPEHPANKAASKFVRKAQ